MKIYINSNYEIKAINTNIDETLTEIEVDRIKVFGNMSDFMILNYCYKVDESGYSVYPAKDYDTLVLIDKQENKISILNTQLSTVQQENADLIYQLMISNVI